MKKKSFVMVLALVLVFAVAVGGVVAWLTDTTGPVKNTFTVGDINIALTETGTNEAGEKSYKMIPGTTLDKDPKVTVKANSEACWLFVKVEKSTNFDTFMTYAMADGWTELDGHDGVYYREVGATTADTSFSVLAGDKVTVKDTVTKTNLNDLTETTYPTLIFTAYAVQKDNINSAADAWSKI